MYLNRNWVMLHHFWCRKCKRSCCCFIQNTFKSKGMFKTVRRNRRGVLRNLVLWKWLFHNVGEINFWLKSLKNIFEDVHSYFSCMLLSWNFTKKQTTSFSIFWAKLQSNAFAQNIAMAASQLFNIISGHKFNIKA